MTELRPEERNRIFEDALVLSKTSRDQVAAAYLIGSFAVGTINEYSDIDVVIVAGRDYARQFHSGIFDGRELQVEVLAFSAFASYIDNYFWYAQNLAWEIGKYYSGASLVREDFAAERISSALRSPAILIRRFLVDFHMGMLSRYSQSLQLGETYLGTLPVCSIISVFAGLRNCYPSSMTARSFLRQAQMRELDGGIEQWLDGGFLERHWPDFVSVVRSEYAQILGPPSGPLFYPQDFSGRALLFPNSVPPLPFSLSLR